MGDSNIASHSLKEAKFNTLDLEERRKKDIYKT